MEQLVDIPYSELKQNPRDYKVLLLRDQWDRPYTEIARELEISTARAIQIYHHVKRKQLRLYARHLAIAHDGQDPSAFQYEKLYDGYGDYKYVSAYWEKEYTELLKEYRSGEPGHSAGFLAELPPPTQEVTSLMEQQVKRLREKEEETFAEIGREMKMTREKARNIYERFYHKKWLAARDKIRSTYNRGKDERDDFMDYYWKYRTARKRFEALVRDYPELFE
ncbi:hypothetical protein [Allofournierella sp.]|uniref:hypothetical protein n=1 Tax=Allofournierella sp. TaxID=1940256 RepID=UPI003AB70B5F